METANTGRERPLLFLARHFLLRADGYDKNRIHSLVVEIIRHICVFNEDGITQ